MTLPSGAASHSAAGGENEFSRPPADGSPLPEIEREMRRGNKIYAIKIFKETFATDLAEAKAAIETLQRGETVYISGRRLRIANPPNPAIFGRVDFDSVKRIKIGVSAAVILLILITTGLLFYFLLGR